MIFDEIYMGIWKRSLEKSIIIINEQLRIVYIIGKSREIALIEDTVLCIGIGTSQVSGAARGEI